MDQQTLNYMGARVDKARDLKRRIGEFESRMIDCNQQRIGEIIVAYIHNGNIYRPTGISLPSDVLRAMIIENLTKQLDGLKKELEEI